MQQLDNPVWFALNSIDNRFNQGDHTVSFFPPDVSPFAGLPDWSASMQQKLYDQLPRERSYSTMVANTIQFTDNWELKFSTMLFQMICPKPVAYRPASPVDCRVLDDTHVPAMLSLTGLTKPGPFFDRTIDFGNYHGVFENDQLVAMAGERLHLNEYTEISAVCTDTDHSGKGYAAFLVSLLAERISQNGKTAFLHVRQDNYRAIEMYTRLGFQKRADMFFGVFQAL